MKPRRTWREDKCVLRSERSQAQMLRTLWSQLHVIKKGTTLTVTDWIEGKEVLPGAKRVH